MGFCRPAQSIIEAVLVFLAACRIAWMICCPGFFPGFWTACSADLLSLRIVADLTRVWDVLQCRRAILLMLTAYRIPISSAACTDHRSMGPNLHLYAVDCFQ